MSKLKVLGLQQEVVMAEKPKETKQEIKQETTKSEAPKQDSQSIDSLPGVGAATAEKLREAGFDTLMSLAVASPAELVEVCAIGESVAKRIINVARSKLDMGFETGIDLLKRRQEVIRLSTGSKAFDAMIGGGFETGCINEVYGEFGCVTPDTFITLADGQMKTIGTIAGDLSEGEYPLRLPVLTWEDEVLSTTLARRLFVYNCSKVLKITLADGRALQVTPNHPLMTTQGWKKAEHLQVGEPLAVSWPTLFPQEEVALSSVIELHEQVSLGRLKQVSLQSMTLNEDLAGILGYYLGEGWSEQGGENGGIVRVSIGSKTPAIIDDWNYLVRKNFGIDTAFRRVENGTETWDINSVAVGEFLRQFDGLYHHTPEKYIPSQIFRSPKHIVAKFLACLYDAEGCAKLEEGQLPKLFRWTRKDGTVKEKVYLANKKGKSMELRSSSLKLLQQAQLLLSKFNIKTSITQDETRGFVAYKLHIYRKENLVRFYNEIGVKTVRLREKLEKILKSYQRELSEPDNDTVFIKSIELVDNPSGKVYDLEVPGTHSFLANNIVSHNSSKSQIAHVLAVRTQLPLEQGGSNGSVIFIDGESTFRPERIKQITEALKLDPIETLKNIAVARAFNSDHQMLIAEKTEDLIKQKMASDRPVRLIVVDSLTSHFRADFVGRGQLADRQQKLNKHMHTLMKLASQYNLCVYVTNQVMAKPDTFFGDPTAAIGGHIVGHNSSTRIYLRKGKKGTRVGKLVDSPYLPDAECIFRITDAGLEDVEE